MINIFTPIELFTLLALILVSIIDIRKKSVPSFLTTAIIFIVAMVNIKNIEWGILGFIFAYFLMEGMSDDEPFFSGIADVKATVVLSLFATSLGEFMLIAILILIYGVVYKIIIKKMFKANEVAFIPVFLITFITLLAIKGWQIWFG